MEARKGVFILTTDRSKLDLTLIRAFLATSYWARNIPLSVVARSIENSLCFGVYEDGKQVGFGRVVTDHATFAWISDVFVLESHRGKGLARWMVECMLIHESLKGIRRWLLATKDAHGVYRVCGFEPVEHPDWFMEITLPDPYGSASGASGD